MKSKFAHGIFMWQGEERRTARYGFFYPSDSNFDGDAHAEATADLVMLGEYLEQRVKVTVVVVENRDSGHLGDRFMDPPLMPTTPEVGESIEFVGILHPMKERYSPCGWSFGIKPSEHREKFWMDPAKWFRLHDQTCDFYIELTDEPDSPITALKEADDTSGAISNGEGSFQYRDVIPPKSIAPKISEIGEGLFLISQPTAHGNPGERFETSFKK